MLNSAIVCSILEEDSGSMHQLDVTGGFVKIFFNIFRAEALMMKKCVKLFEMV